jgi:hypothetical protein
LSFSPHVWSMPRAFCACAFGFAGLALLPLTSSAQQAPSNVLIATLTPVTHPALPNAPSALLFSPTETGTSPDTLDTDDSSSNSDPDSADNQDLKDPHQRTQDNSPDTKKKPVPPIELDSNGNPIPLNRRQPQRILGFMPNFRSVSGGAVAHPPGWKYNFQVATHQSFDYSSFIFLGITSLSAEGLNSHPVLGKGVDGFYAYTWRGLLDKTDGTYLSAWFLPSLLHEDTRYYAMGRGHSIPIRALYVISRQAVAQTYGGKQTPNIAGLGGKVLTQVISREYYPAGATSFGVLATKFAYASMRDIAFTSIREFYPDIAAHYVRTHREKVAHQAARDAQAAGVH